ncbi:hypothetical protein HPB51_002112 [Rhipicephalus microplus]|uniref:Uncharacterized protein n=1 Tax=Rhipicephalus microplus TaxID=6941 RepID=A0A9J6E597_RHIMP|nr:hypothetical protein HPB51_002112 [Rhipicephalus microplus]
MFCSRASLNQQSRGSRVPLSLSSECATNDRKALVTHRGYSEEGVHPDDRHYDTSETHRSRRPSGCQACGCIGRCRGRHAGRFSSTFSCPTLLSRDSPVARGTQTEQAAMTRSCDCQTEPLAAADVLYDRAVDEHEVPIEMRTAAVLDSTPPFPRHRSNSFVCAIQGGNAAAAEAFDNSGISKENSTADSGSAKPPLPKLTFEDFDGQRRDGDEQTRKAALRKCLLEVGRSVAMDLDQPDGSTGSPRPRGASFLSGLDSLHLQIASVSSVRGRTENPYQSPLYVYTFVERGTSTPAQFRSGGSRRDWRYCHRPPTHRVSIVFHLQKTMARRKQSRTRYQVPLDLSGIQFEWSSRLGVIRRRGPVVEVFRLPTGRLRDRIPSVVAAAKWREKR